MFKNNKSEDDVIQLGRSIIRESELEIPVDYKGEVFTLKYPTPSMSAAIEAEIARRLGGYPRASYSVEHVAGVEATVTVDALYIPEKCPKWFRGPWTCYDEELVGRLFEGYYQFRDKFRERLRSGGFEEGDQGKQP